MSHTTWIRRPAALLTAVALVLIFSPVLRAQQPQTPAGPLAPEKYKNIQVLTNVPADQIDLTMRYVAAAVGMQCISCHVQDSATGEWAYEKDDKRNKQTARQMMKMVYAINGGNFGITAACATCHGGRNQPAGLQLAEMMTPDQIVQMNAIAARGAQPTAPAGAPAGGRGAQPPAPPIDDVLNKYFDAVGGRAALEKVQSITMSGSIATRAGQSIPFTIDAASGKYRETQQMRPDVTTRGFDGKVGWLQTGSRTVDLSGFALDQALRTHDLGSVLHIKDKYPMLQASGRPIPINGKDTTVITGRAGVTTEQFYFDAASGLLIRRVITTRTPLGSLREQIDYGDYRTVSGIKVPFEIKRSNWETLDTLKVTDLKINAPIDDNRFAKPR